MTFEFNCLVLDSHPSIFAVQISETDTVATLKEKIKEKTRPTFDHIAAHTLDLWNVSVPIEGLSDTHLHDLQPVQAPLLPVKRLSRLFPNTPPEEYLHIIVRPPAVAGASSTFFVSFNISYSLQHLQIHSPFLS
ncbi:hypothetical protein DFJ43DRAFT_1066600 [Lentinula guzmanii]|uniref:Crinkler effector protein N-terminal domain-containing protein n=1 Tax=Lentinula guzmanii TaxID=2804957 RepID=A0AA38JFC9_9AGAR|nr:hypothetical protein DFJ43DRAFT_1066600 [Lentinula guzmanii]